MNTDRLSSAHDDWTGDPEIDRMRLVARAMAAGPVTPLPRVPDPVQSLSLEFAKAAVVMALLIAIVTVILVVVL